MSFRCLLAFFLFASGASAQWVEEKYPLKAGYNAIWLSLDVSHAASIDSLLAGFPEIEVLWQWNPHSTTAQFTQSPAEPDQPDAQWFKWDSNGFDAADNVDPDTMSALAGNAAYLVKASADVELKLIGKPLPPKLSWSSSGLNFFGFPMRASAPTDFDRFLSFSEALSAGPGIFAYEGGPLASNPVPVIQSRNVPVVRGSAYWIRSSQFADYYAPLRVSVSRSGLDFGDVGNVSTVRIKNVTKEDVTLTFSSSNSAPPPVPPAVAGVVPLRIRSGLDPQTAQFIYTDLASHTPPTLGPGEEIEFVFAVDRVGMGGTAGQVFQSILQIRDSLNVSRIDLPVRALTTSRAGLWIGEASVSTVEQITASNRRETAGGEELFVDEDGELTSVDTGVPAYVTTATGEGVIVEARDANAAVRTPFPLRLIFHRASNNEFKLLQQVYLGEGDSGSLMVSTSQEELNASRLTTAKRLSSAAFPLGLTQTATSGNIGLTGNATFNVSLSHMAKTNPFIHTYHPDHDSKVDGTTPPADEIENKESFNITRDITLTWESDPANLSPPLEDLGWGSTTLGGTYAETIQGLRAQDIHISGTFVLYRVSDLATLFPEAP